MSLLYQPNGNLMPGIHPVAMRDIEIYFGYNERRRELIEGLKIGVQELKSCGCAKIYLDGSFVTKKLFPGDFDACWDPTGVDLANLKQVQPLFFDFKDNRQKQKDHFGGEFFPSNISAIQFQMVNFLDFFQIDKDGNPKGIVLII